MKVAELHGVLLDWWVCRAELEEFVGMKVNEDTSAQMSRKIGSLPFHPSTNWHQGGPIIVRECITLVCWEQDLWEAYMGVQRPYLDVAPGWDADGSGGTPLVAAMRAYVASKYGEEVPDEGK